MRLSLNQCKELKERLSPLLEDFRSHQGWLSQANADENTRKILAVLREYGVDL